MKFFQRLFQRSFPSLCLLIRIQSDVWRALKRDGACFSFKRSYPSLEIFRSFISFTYLDKVYGYRDCFFFFIIGYQLSLLVETFLKIFLETWSLASFTYTDIKWCLRCKGNRACFFLRCFYPSLEIFRSFISFAYLDKVYEAWTVQIIRVVFFLN